MNYVHDAWEYSIDPKLSRKQNAITVASHVLETLSHKGENGEWEWDRLEPDEVRTWSSAPGLSLEGFPAIRTPDPKQEWASGWLRLAGLFSTDSWSHITVDRNKVIPTAWAKRNFFPRNGGKTKAYSEAVSIAKETRDREVYFLEKMQAIDWKKMSPYHRATMLTVNVIGRFLLDLPKFHRRGLVKYIRHPPMPSGVKHLHTRNIEFRNPKAGVGFPLIRGWNKIDSRMQTWYKSAARRLFRQLQGCNSIAEMMSVVQKWIRYFKILAHRSQGKGRPVINVSKVINICNMMIYQSLQWEMNKYAWFFIGNHDMRLLKLKMLSRAKKYSYLLESDDTCIVVFLDGKKYYISVDDSGFDHGVKPVDYDGVVRTLEKVFDDSLHYVFKGLLAISQYASTITPWGIAHKQPWYGLISGGAGTKVIGSVVQGLRFESARRAFDNSLWHGLDWLNISGEFKFPEGMTIEDFMLTKTCTLCQLIYSEDRPDFIFNSLIRTARNMYELESFSSDPQPGDIMVVMGLVGLYGHEKFEDYVNYVVSKWDFRTPSKELTGLLRNYFKTARVYNSSPSGYERLAINKTIELIYPKYGLKVVG